MCQTPAGHLSWPSTWSAYDGAHAVAGNGEVESRLNSIINELRKVQLALGEGYLSAFPKEHFVRLQSLQGVWAPFYVVRMSTAPTYITLSVQTNAHRSFVGRKACTLLLGIYLNFQLAADS